MRALWERMLQISIAKKLYGGFFIVLSLIIFAVFFSALRFSEIRDLYTKTTLVSEINHYLDQSKIARVKLFYTLDEENTSNMMKYVSQIIAQQEKERQLRWQESDVQHFQRLSEQLTQYQHELEEIVLAATVLRGQKHVVSVGENIQNTHSGSASRRPIRSPLKRGLPLPIPLAVLRASLMRKISMLLTIQSRRSLLSVFVPFCWEY